MSDLEITMLIQKFAEENDLYSKEVRNLLSEGGVERLISQYKNISRRLDKMSDENLELKKNIKAYEDAVSELGHAVSVLEEAIDTLRSRCTESARELFDRNCYGGLTIVCHSKEMEFENKQLKQRIAELEDKIGDRDEINRCLREKVAELESKNEKLFDCINGITGNTKEEIRNNIDNIKKINKKPIKSHVLIVAKEINGQDYVGLEDFMSVVNDLQAEIGT